MNSYAYSNSERYEDIGLISIVYRFFENYPKGREYDRRTIVLLFLVVDFFDRFGRRKRVEKEFNQFIESLDLPIEWKGCSEQEGIFKNYIYKNPYRLFQLFRGVQMNRTDFLSHIFHIWNILTNKVPEKFIINELDYLHDVFPVIHFIAGQDEFSEEDYTISRRAARSNPKDLINWLVLPMLRRPKETLNNKKKLSGFLKSAIDNIEEEGANELLVSGLYFYLRADSIEISVHNRREGYLEILELVFRHYMKVYSGHVVPLCEEEFKDEEIDLLLNICKESVPMEMLYPAYVKEHFRKFLRWDSIRFENRYLL